MPVGNVDSAARLHLRRELEAHLSELGYTADRRLHRVGTPQAEIVRVSPVRGRLVYGETVLRTDLRRRTCHDRLKFFANRRTRKRSQILFFVAVEDACRVQLEALLAALGIRDGVRGGNVHVLSVPRPVARRSAR